MSRSIDLFIDADQPPDEVAAALGRLVGSTLIEDPDTGAWLLSHADVQADLTEHRYADDGNLPFSHFRYSLSARVANTVRPQDAPATNLLRQIADLTHRRLGWPVLMVMDLQYRDQQADPSSPVREAGEADVDPDGAVVSPGWIDAVPGDVDVEPDGVEVAADDPETATGAAGGR
jgi:hypothetical protein